MYLNRQSELPEIEERRVYHMYGFWMLRVDAGAVREALPGF